jgi:tRNA (guanine37-N1)-methyltransferase
MIWRIRIGTIFPGIFPGPLGISCIGRNKGITWDMDADYLGKFIYKGRIDDETFGGGGGMIIKAEVVDNWIHETQSQNKRKIFMSPRGKVFNHSMIPGLLAQDICILCGRYEGVDQRVIDYWNFEEISIGDFILHGGEVAAMVMLESCLRFLSVKQHSLDHESFTNNLLEANNYTRPESWTPRDQDKVYKVPEVLLSGHHANVKSWRLQNSIEITKKFRPDLLEN